MMLLKRKVDEAEILFQSFIKDLEKEGFDAKVFDRGKIKQHLGRGLYRVWEEALSVLNHRKIIIVFEKKEPKVSWPSYSYFDRIVINIARAPDKEALQKSEKELFELESELAEKELS